jgi:hypothetical protein
MKLTAFYLPYRKAMGEHPEGGRGPLRQSLSGTAVTSPHV